MKKTVGSFVVLAVLATALSGLSLAQDDTYCVQDDTYCVRAKIPFDFYAGDQQLPSGTYVIDASYDTDAVTFHNNDTGRTYYALAQPASLARSSDAFGPSPSRPPMLEFDVTANTHLLADLKTATTAVHFAESKRLRNEAHRTGSLTIVAALR